jgi:lysozyme
MRNINQTGIDLIKVFEGCKLEAYQDVVGIWTIGYGHTGPEVVKGLKWTQAQADTALHKDLEEFCRSVEAMTKSVPLTDNQFAALVSFAFNLGAGRLRTSTLLKKVLTKDWAGAKLEFAKWDKAGGKPVPGLTRRRRAEADLFGAT